jgi:Glu-tRNA(Gln) amidotransferase subunit E-like FAD-binding protein
MPNDSTNTRAVRRNGDAFEPTPEQVYSVELMASIGLPQDAIAEALQITAKTLRKHFKHQLATGKTRTIAKVADALVRQALAGNITAMIFFLKTQAGWKETQKVEHSGNIARLSDEELERIARGDA